jgi:site-specific DNA-methyltransferase (adenine-specific)
MQAFYKSPDRCFTLHQGNCVEVLKQFDFEFDMIFADPPYFLSNDGFSVQSGQPVSVNKGEWDRSKGHAFVNDFNYQWLNEVRRKLKENGTIWVSGTYHNIFSVAQMLNELNFKILNVVTWVKTNPPPNLACRCFTHSSEVIIWARKNKTTPHYFNYELMRKINGGKQMKDVWELSAIARWEKSCGKHPTQKPLALMARIIQASTQTGAWILDPFTGSSTTGIAANLLGRKFLGIDKELPFLEMSRRRREEINNLCVFEKYREKIQGFKNELPRGDLLLQEERVANYEAELPF